MDKRNHTPLGPVGSRVAKNLRRVRNSRTVDGERFTTRRLARTVSDLGIPMSASAVTKIEKQDRRMTVDELVAFAEALGVPVLVLLEESECGTCNGAPPVGFTCNGCATTGAAA